MTVISAKAQGKDDRSDGVVVSFGAQWYPKLLNAAFSVIIRKRVPSSAHPKWLYFHINSPISKICGRAKITSIKTLTKSDAVAISASIDLSMVKILDYIGACNSINCYEISDIEIAQHKMSAEDSNFCLTYSPPQSFSFYLFKENQY